MRGPANVPVSLLLSRLTQTMSEKMRHILRSLFARNGKCRFGGYEPIRLVARGGMSEVWEARHRRTGEVFALKILNSEPLELKRTFQKIFEAEEGRIALKLDHPNVVHTVDYSRTGKDYYIVMEFIAGPNLERLILQGDERLHKSRFDVVVQVARGLDYLHRQHLIHRDFCPKNILYDSGGTAKIIDFGLTIPAASRPRSMVDISGTASYMAPEQIKRVKLDERTDIYAFGVTAFEILTGKRPFPTVPDRERRLQQHLNLAPTPLREADASLPRELEDIVAKCIEKDPDLRYKSMGEVMKGLLSAIGRIPDGPRV